MTAGAPDGWKRTRLGWATTYVNVKSSVDEIAQHSEVFHYSIPAVQALGTGQVEGGDSIDSDKLVVDRPLLLVSKLNPRKGTMCLADVQDDFYTVASGEFIPMAADGSHLPYLRYLCLSSSFRQELEARVSSATRSHQRVHPHDILHAQIALPPVGLQIAIADFLDRETAQIDAMIGKQEELVGLLGERRSAVIAHAVTKGLNPQAPMVDSGVEWLGDIPAHWETAPIKRVTIVVTDGAHVSPETDGGTFDFVSTRDVKDGWIDFESSLKTSPASYDYLVRTGCKPYVNDVLFSKDGTVGRTVVVRQPAEFVVASSLIILRPDPSRVLPDFLDLACKGSAFQEQVNSVVKGAGLPRVSITNLRKMVLAVPPLEEQAGIVADVAPKVEQIKALVAKAEESILLMRERRAALISDAVTGRLDIETYGRSDREGVA